MNKLKWAVFLMFTLGVGACSTTKVALPYVPAPTTTAITANPIIEMGSVVDERKNGTHALGAIRNGFGGSLKILETQPPVAEVVKAAFEGGLKARGLAAPAAGSKYQLNVTILKFDCSQLVRREAHARFLVMLVAVSGKSNYEHETIANEVEGSRFALDTDIFASVEDLRKVANELLKRAVDEALDAPGLRAYRRANSTS
jgi:hypothetical protein